MFKSRYRYLFITFLSIYSYVNIKFTEGDQLFTGKVSELVLFTVVAGLIFFIWEGNRILIGWILRGRTFRTIFHELGLGFVIGVSWVYILSFLTLGLEYLLGFTFNMTALKLIIGFNFRINLFLHCINAIWHYHQRLRLKEVEAEVAKKENANARYEALRRQINPHFLFNSLNVLDGLIRKSPKQASHYLEELSSIYRYLTSMEEREVILLSEELDFIKSYEYLLSVRFRDNFKLELDIDQENLGKFIVPAALQMIVENCIKHNVISQENPLTVKIYSNNNSLIVRNKIHKKVSKSETSGIGLLNIQRRYEFLGDKKPSVTDNDDEFIVELPLLDINSS